MDLSKLRVPAGAVRVEVDNPDDCCITKPSGVISGWFATADWENPEEFQFRVGPIILPHTHNKRADVEGAMVGHRVAGFQIRFDLIDCLPYIEDNRMVIQLVLLDYQPFPLRFTVKESALASCLAAAGGV